MNDSPCFAATIFDASQKEETNVHEVKLRALPHPNDILWLTEFQSDPEKESAWVVVEVCHWVHTRDFHHVAIYCEPLKIRKEQGNGNDEDSDWVAAAKRMLTKQAKILEQVAEIRGAHIPFVVEAQDAVVETALLLALGKKGEQ